MNPPRIKVLYLIERLARAGTELHLVRLLERLDRRRFLPVLCCLNGADTDRSLIPPDVPFRHLDAPWNLITPRSIALFNRLTQLIRQEQPTILHTFLFVADVLGPFAARRAGRPAIVSSRGRMGIEWQAGPLHRIAQRAANRRTDAIACKTAAMRDEIARTEGVPLNRIHIIPNGVDLQRFQVSPGMVGQTRRQLEQKHGISADGPLILAVGNLKPIKGHRTLIEAAARLANTFPRLQTVLVGQGESHDELRALRDTLGLAQRVHLPGPADDVRLWMRAADIFVAPSRSEGMPNALLEAMAMGLPPVLSDIPGHREAADHTAWYFVPGDAASLAQALQAALQAPERRAERARAAQQRVERLFSIDSMMQTIEELYTRIAPRAGAPR